MREHAEAAPKPDAMAPALKRGVPVTGLTPGVLSPRGSPAASANVVVMRRSGAWLTLAALSIPLASSVASAEPPAAPAAPAALAAPAAATQPVEEPPYDASQHGGYSYGAWIKMTRGTARRSTGMMATGIGFIGLGAILMATGTGIYAAGDSCKLEPIVPVGGGGTIGTGPLLPCGPHTAHTTGLALLGTGVISLGIGIPLTALGADEVPRLEAGSARILNPPRQPYISLALGLRNVGVTLHF